MKFTIARSELLQLIGKIQSVVPAKPTIPILSNVLLEAYADQIIISATDLTVSVRTFTDAKVLEEGSITVPARHLFQLMREITAPQIEVESSEEIVHLSAGSSKFKLNGMSKSEFPAMPDFADAASFIVNGDQLKALLSKTAFAAARDDSRHVLNGILMTLNGHDVGFTATDGKRLARVGSTLETMLPAEGSYILPLKAVEEIVRLDPSENTKIMIDQEKIAIESEQVTFVTKLLAGDYPDIERVIPKSCPLTVHLHRDELISCLKQVSLFTTDRAHSVRFQFSNGELKLLVASSELGEGSVTMPVDYDGQALEIAFNPGYFLDMLRHSKDETVRFSMIDPYNPGLVTDESKAQFVIMPMRIEQPANVA